MSVPFMDFILDSNGFSRKMANYDERFKDKKFMKSKFADLSAKMVAVGYDPEKPANFLQMKTFVRSFSQMLNLNTRMTGMIDRTNADKKALRSKISSKGPVYQYYAHKLWLFTKPNKPQGAPWNHVIYLPQSENSKKNTPNRSN